MAKRKLRVLKCGGPIIGICEGYFAQFRPIFTGAIAAKAEIRVRFTAHKCMLAARSAVKVPKVA